MNSTPHFLRDKQGFCFPTRCPCPSQGHACPARLFLIGKLRDNSGTAQGQILHRDRDKAYLYACPSVPQRKSTLFLAI
jgi:hypothetical protein